MRLQRIYPFIPLKYVILINFNKLYQHRTILLKILKF
jgi:hypothetical protein